MPPLPPAVGGPPPPPQGPINVFGFDPNAKPPASPHPGTDPHLLNYGGGGSVVSGLSDVTPNVPTAAAAAAAATAGATGPADSSLIAALSQFNKDHFASGSDGGKRVYDEDTSQNPQPNKYQGTGV